MSGRVHSDSQDQEVVEYTWCVPINSLRFSRARARVPFPLPMNFTRVANNVLCSARLHPARGAVLSLLVMLMTFARYNIVVETHARA